MCIRDSLYAVCNGGLHPVRPVEQVRHHKGEMCIRDSVCNLAPRPMMKGKYVSEGMIFAADTADGGCAIPFYSDDTPVGARIH